LKESHKALREGTRDEHERLDALLAAFDLADSSAYAAFLAVHAAALLPIEAALDDAVAERLVPDWSTRRRGDALLADLAALGEPVPPALAVPAPTDDATTLGMIYVVEGSRLGGRFLARSVGHGLPQAYLGTPQAAGNWAKLLARIDALLYMPGDLSRAVDGARAAFALFEAAGRDRVPKVG